MSHRSSIGTDVVRNAGADLIAPAYSRDVVRESDIMRSGLLSAHHVHKWSVMSEETDRNGQTASACNTRGLMGNALTKNLIESEDVRERVMEAIRRRELMREDVEAALNWQSGSSAADSSVQEVYSRVVSIARKSQAWSENR